MQGGFVGHTDHGNTVMGPGARPSNGFTQGVGPIPPQLSWFLNPKKGPVFIFFLLTYILYNHCDKVYFEIQ